jgi:hypothetical protein
MVNKVKEFDREHPGVKGALIGAIGGPLGSLIGYLATRQHGGMVPGAPGQAVPIMAHGGERVVPRAGVDVNAPRGSGGVTINMTGPVSMRDDRDIQILADNIIRIIGRRNELERLGVGLG